MTSSTAQRRGRPRRAALAALTVVGMTAVMGASAMAAPVPSTDDPITYEKFGAIHDPGKSAPDYFQPFWYDTDGRHIQAHGGQIVTVTEDGQEVHYWYGEDRSNGYYASPGVSVYRSTDLLNWTNEGVAMRSVTQRSELTDEYFDALYDTVDDNGVPNDDRIDDLNYHLNTTETEAYTSIFERPKVLYNEDTDQWVMWWHSDGRITPGGSTYARSLAAVAVSDSPTGPFTLTGAYRMYNRANYQACTSSAVPGQARDMTVFKDDDGTAYIVYSSEENNSLYISRLNAEYTNVEHTTTSDPIGFQYSADGQYPYIFADGTPEAPVRGVDFQIVKECGWLEAPALFKNGDTYHVLASGATGWDPNPQTYHSADELLGTWIRGVESDDIYENVSYNSIPEGGDGLLSVGDARRTTFGSQSTNVLTLAPGKYVYMGDRWNSGNNDSTYVWLPLTVSEGGRLEMHNPAVEDPERWGDGWDASYWDDKGYGVGVWRVVNDGLPRTVARGSDSASVLPESVTVDSAGTERETAVTWSTLDTSLLGPQTVTGTLAADDTFSAGRTFTRTVTVTAAGLINLAPDATVAVSSRSDLAPLLVDQDVKGKGWDDWVSGGNYPKASTLTFTWAAPQRLDSIAVHTYKDGGATWPSAITTEYRTPAGAWVSAPLTAALDQDVEIVAPVALMDASELPEVTGVRLRLTTQINTWQAISEVQIWGEGTANVCREPGVKVSASFHQTEWDTFPPALACDGKASTFWSTWLGGDKLPGATFTIEAPGVYDVDTVAFTNIEGTLASVGVEYRTAGGEWLPTTAQDVVPAANNSLTTLTFDKVAATALRLNFSHPGSYLKITEIVVPDRTGEVVVPPVDPPVESPFVDVAVDNPFFEEIVWLASEGVSTGWLVSDGAEFRPYNNVTRDAMAAFLYRLAGSPEFTAPAVSPFRDVSTSNGFYREIAWLASEEISTGWPVAGGTAEFRPYAHITRDAMAAFLYRYSGEPDFTAPAVSPFVDVTPATPFYREITWLADTGVSTGWPTEAGQEYRPVAKITRDAMAAFLHRLDQE